MTNTRILRTTGFVVLALGAVAALGALAVRDQISRHRRDLFSDHPLSRLAALGYLSGVRPTVETVLLLRDFVSWESRPLIRRRAEQLLARMEEALRRGGTPTGEVAG